MTLSSDSPAFWETRREVLLRTGKAVPRFLQGVFPFTGRGMFEIAPLDSMNGLSYTVPPAHVAQFVYFRAGNASDDLLYLAVAADKTPLRYFPIGPKSDCHVPLAIVESHPAGTVLEIVFAAPPGLTGTLIVDVGLMEVDAASAAQAGLAL